MSETYTINANEVLTLLNEVKQKGVSRGTCWINEPCSGCWESVIAYSQGLVASFLNIIILFNI